jgi:hypothetical protein
MRRQKLEARSQKLEARSQKPEVRSKNISPAGGGQRGWKKKNL